MYTKRLNKHNPKLSIRETNNLITNSHASKRSHSNDSINLAAGNFSRRKFTSAASGAVSIAEIVSDATGGGYYNCVLMILDATDWDTAETDQLEEIDGVNVVVLNLAEIGTSIHNLDAGDLIICWQINDDEGTARYIGTEVFGRHTFGEWM